MMEGSNIFRFKKFAVTQLRCAMKVGTDGVLLGSWTKVKATDVRALDVGTGTGIIALMLAQRSGCMIDAIDIDRDAFDECEENFARSEWGQRLKCYHVGLQDFIPEEKGVYDLIVSNPPFFIDAYKSGTDARNVARHINERLTFDELVDNVKRLLKPEGRFSVILPVKEGNIFIELGEKKGLFCNKIMRVKTKEGKLEKRLMLEMGQMRGRVVAKEMIIHDAEGNYSREFVRLTQDFYTHFPVREVMSE